MKWIIPAKTFLVGEYAAILGEGAILLTTKPSFLVTLSAEKSIQGIHPASPAGQWSQQHRASLPGISFVDPYAGKGGLGASSAQFLGAYLANSYTLGVEPQLDGLMQAYLEASWQGKGIWPSGYDILAQTQSGCVYVERRNQLLISFSWPFTDISFVLLHSGQKLATHSHLQTMHIPEGVEKLPPFVEKAREAFKSGNSSLLLDAVNGYQAQLVSMNLIAKHSLTQLAVLAKIPGVLAAKGCGALGADILLLLVQTEVLPTILLSLRERGFDVLATHQELYQGSPLMKSE